MYLVQKPSIIFSALSSIVAGLRVVGHGFLSVLDTLADANIKAQKAEELVSLTDDQLAARGLTRADIPHVILGTPAA